MDPIVQVDRSGARYVTFPAGAPVDGAVAQGARAQAHAFVQDNAKLLALAPEMLRSLPLAPARQPEEELAGLRFAQEKRVMDSLVVGYTQTYFGLPVIGAGVTVTLRDQPRRVLAAVSTVHRDLEVERPSAAALRRAQAILAGGAGKYGSIREVGLTPPDDGVDPQIHAARLVVFRYDASRRVVLPDPEDAPDERRRGPSIPLAPVPESVRDGSFRVAIEVHAAMSLSPWGRLNWRAYVDVETNAVLQLRPLVDHVTASVFLRDPTTKGSSHAPNATSAQLNALRDSVVLDGLSAPVAGTQQLAGELVTVVDAVLPSIAPPGTSSPYDFTYDSRTDHFGATNTYFQCDRFFRLVRDLGFTIATYFDGTSFPIRADHRGFGGAGLTRNARCPGNATGNGIGTVEFALADLTDTTNPLSIAADWRVVLHELGGHGILWDHVDDPNFGFAHSAGDSMAAILNDPSSAAPDRFVTFPWVNFIGRRHDRTPAAGWGWGGPNDHGDYDSEQILSSTLFRLYRAIGGDSPSLARRELAARTVAYLILRAVGQLTPQTNPSDALGFEHQLGVADGEVWTSTSPAETHAGGAYRKVIRWAFEKQGLFRGPGMPATSEGAPPDVDVYIDDGRAGEYGFLANHWSCTDIWNRRSPGAGGGVHEEPVVGQTNYAYVRIKNRGTQAATGVVVRGFHCLPGIGLVYPDDWAPMTTAQLAAPDLTAGDATGVIVGPFEWSPSQVGHECMFFSVSAAGDASNIDERITGSIPEWRLVPHDNNIAQRNVHPVAAALTDDELASRRFWLRNPLDRATRIELAAELPRFLEVRGWKLAFVSPGGAGFGLKAGALKEVRFAMVAGRPFERGELPGPGAERTITITAAADGIPLGGMSYVIDPDYVDPNKGTGPIAPCRPGRDLGSILGCLNRTEAELERVEVRKVLLELTFKERGC